MSSIVLMILGIALCFAGARSIRVTVAVAGFGGGWLLAQALHASLRLTVLVGFASAVLVIISMMLMARFIFLVSGVCLGAIVGAKAFQLLNGPGHNWLLAVIVVPAVGLLGGIVLNRWRRPFLRWATSFAGAALALSGLGRLGPDILRGLWRPETVVGGVVLAAAWIVLTVVGHRVQAAGPRRERRRKRRGNTDGTP